MIELYRLYVDCHHKNPYSALSSSVAINLLSCLYKRFVREKEIKPIEELSKEEKENYIKIGEKYENDKYKKYRIARAAYALTLISGE
jgi:hypothetical protein